MSQAIQSLKGDKEGSKPPIMSFRSCANMAFNSPPMTSFSCNSTMCFSRCSWFCAAVWACRPKANSKGAVFNGTQYQRSQEPQTPKTSYNKTAYLGDCFHILIPFPRYTTLHNIWLQSQIIWSYGSWHSLRAHVWEMTDRQILSICESHQDMAHVSQRFVNQNLSPWITRILQHGIKPIWGRFRDRVINFSDFMWRVYLNHMDFCHAIPAGTRQPSQHIFVLPSAQQDVKTFPVGAVKPWSCCSRHPMRVRNCSRKSNPWVFVAFI